MARRFTTSLIAAASARSDFRNFSRAGVAKKRSRTSTRVPSDRATGLSGATRPPSTAISKASAAPRWREAIVSRAAAPIAASASPRKPRLADVVEAAVELGGAVPLDGEREVVAGDAAAVVGHPGQRDAAGGGDHLDPPGAGVDRVLDELLHHARRPLDHLARGDAVDHGFVETADRT